MLPLILLKYLSSLEILFFEKSKLPPMDFGKPSRFVKLLSDQLKFPSTITFDKLGSLVKPMPDKSKSPLITKPSGKLFKS